MMGALRSNTVKPCFAMAFSTFFVLLTAGSAWAQESISTAYYVKSSDNTCIELEKNEHNEKSVLSITDGELNTSNQNLKSSPRQSVKDCSEIVDETVGETEHQLKATLGQVAATAGSIASSLNSDLISAALDGNIEPGSGGLSPTTAAASGSVASQFMVSGYKWRSHDGFAVSSASGTSTTPGFDEDNYGLTVGTRFDGSSLFDAPPSSVTLGVLANYTHTEIEVDAPSGGTKGGSAEVDSWSAGAYGLVTDGRRYGLFSVTGTYGSPETSNDVVPASAEFNNFGVSASALTGILLSAGATTKLDLRGGLTFTHATSDDYTDSASVSYTNGHMEAFSGSVSARLFSIVQADGYNLRPFVQTGLSHRFHYENELDVDGETFAFDEADTSVFARAGVDFSLSDSTQAYLAVRGEASEDYESIAGQVGITFKLD